MRQELIGPRFLHARRSEPLCESHSGAKPSHKQEPAVSPVTTPGGRHTVLMQRASNASPVRVRPGDEASLDDLCDGPLNTVWQSQFHQLHGPDNSKSGWRPCRRRSHRGGEPLGTTREVRPFATTPPGVPRGRARRAEWLEAEVIAGILFAVLAAVEAEVSV